MRRAFVIGDVHGHWDRLVALLKKASILTEIEGVYKMDPEIDVIQLGDLGHFGADTGIDDSRAYELALQFGIIVLWGNHDRAVVDAAHRFSGYTPPYTSTIQLMERVNPKLAWHSHGYLLTHAGLNPTYVQPDWKKVPKAERAEYIASRLTIIDASPIGQLRGGWSKDGGILWRDRREPLWDGVDQIFGHSRGLTEYILPNSYCIDTGGISDGNLTGIWLPDKKLVSVGEDAEINEKGTIRY